MRSPSTRRIERPRISSQIRKASGSTLRRLAESSSVRSSRLCAALSQATRGSAASSRARLSMFSALIGLRLNGMALEPT